jgi:hypothetical protein
MREDYGLNCLLVNMRAEERSNEARLFEAVGEASSRNCRRVFFGDLFFSCDNLRVKIAGALLGID